MIYTGKLYGRSGNGYIPLIMTSDDVDELVRERDEARAIAKEACSMLAANNFETNYPPMPWEEPE